MALGLRQSVDFGPRTVRCLLSVDDLFDMDRCCRGDCSHMIGKVGCLRQSDVYVGLVTERDQDIYILTYVLWSTTFVCSA